MFTCNCVGLINDDKNLRLFKVIDVPSGSITPVLRRNNCQLSRFSQTFESHFEVHNLLSQFVLLSPHPLQRLPGLQLRLEVVAGVGPGGGGEAGVPPPLGAEQPPGHRGAHPPAGAEHQHPLAVDTRSECQNVVTG